MHYTRVEAIAEIVRRTDVDADDADAAGGCTDARVEAIIADMLEEREERAKEAIHVQELDRRLASRREEEI